MYYIGEANCSWIPTKAKTLKGAKIAAERKRVYQGTDLSVGVKDRDGIIWEVSRKTSRDEQWRDLEPHPNLQ